MDLVSMLKDHALWVSVLSVVVGGLVRCLKSDTVATWPVLGPIMSKIPPRARGVVAIFLGEGLGALFAVVHGDPPVVAILGGLIAAFGAMGGHNLLIEVLRQGREVYAAKSGGPPGGGSTGAQDAPQAPSASSAGQDGGASSSGVPSVTERRPAAFALGLVSVVFGSGAVLAVVLAGCGPKSAAAAADGWQVVARGVYVAQALNHACAVTGKARGDVALLDTCADTYDLVIDGLERLEIILEEQGDPSCVAVSLDRDLAAFAAALRAKGVGVPEAVPAALEVSKLFAEAYAGHACPVAAPATDGGTDGQ